MTTHSRQRIVVVGGGIAGVATCAALRGGGFDGELVLLDAGAFPHDRPPLSKQYLSGEKDDEAIALQSAQWYEKQDIQLRTRTRVSRIDPDTMIVHTESGDLGAERIVLAMGGQAARPPLPGADDDRVHVLRDIEDARRLRDCLRPGVRALVVGAGLIGAEVASTLVDLGSTVTLVDPVDLPLAGAVGAHLAAWMHGVHRARGIETRCAGVERFDATSDGLVATLTDGSEPVVADIVILGVGMVPNDRLASEAGLDVDRGVIVDDCQQTSHAGIYAVGDVARRRGSDGLLLPRVEHWEAAQHDAARVAAHMLGHQPPPAGAAWFWTDRHGRHIEVVGSLAGPHELVWRGSAGDRPFAVFALDGSRMVGALAVDDTKIARAARRLIDQRIRVDRAALADPAYEPRKLLKR